MLVNSAIAGNGIALSRTILRTRPCAKARCRPCCADFPIPELWVKATIPERRVNAAAVQALLRELKSSLSPVL